MFENVMSTYEGVFMPVIAPQKATAEGKRGRYPSNAGEFASYLERECV